MNRRCLTTAIAVLVLVPRLLPGQTNDADSLFARGALDAARLAYEQRLAAAPDDHLARTRLGLIALWDNRLSVAESLLTSAVAANPDDRPAVEALAETFYRQKRFTEAAPLYRQLGRTGAADKLAGLDTPYDVSLPDGGTTIPFAPGAVLPVLSVHVNGREAFFLLDTGAGETIIDDAFASAVGARIFGSDSGAYAGGRVAAFAHGAIDSLTMGDMRVRQVPVHVQSTRAYSAAAGGRAVSGIIGTGVLAQFRAELDFGAQTLTLHGRTAPLPSEAGTAIRFWLLGDHFITMPAMLADSVHTLLVFDTGLAMPGGALVPSASVLEEAGIRPEGDAVSGVGGGGAVTVTPFRVERLRVGSITKTDLLAVAGAFPPILEHRFGPRIGGLLSHGFFADQRVTLDFDAMHLRVSPSGETSHPSEAEVSPADSASVGSRMSLEDRARHIVDLLGAERYAELAPFWSTQLRQQLPPESIGAAWQSLVTTLGTVRDILPVRTEASPGAPADARVAHVPVRFGNVLIGITLTFDETDRVSGVSMQPMR